MKLFLHAGSGRKTYEHIPVSFKPPDWKEVRFDIDPTVVPDILGSITDMRQISDDYYDAVFTSHTIEHLYAHEIQKTLREFFRVIKPNGYAVVVCPDLEIISQMITEGKLGSTIYESAEGPITPLDMLYGHGASIARGEKYMSHNTGFTLSTLSQSLRDAGFAFVKGIRLIKGYELWVLATKSFLPQNELDELVKEHLPL
jgi:ubiquinone/menaquinone biosynthesis C-methylase UbiE